MLSNILTQASKIWDYLGAHTHSMKSGHEPRASITSGLLFIHKTRKACFLLSLIPETLFLMTYTFQIAHTQSQMTRLGSSRTDQDLMIHICSQRGCFFTVFLIQRLGTVPSQHPQSYLPCSVFHFRGAYASVTLDSLCL